MRPFVLILLVSGAAAAAPGQVRLGGDLGVLMREEASGHRTALAIIGPRAAVGLSDRLSLSLAYGVSYVSEGTVARATTLHQRFALRPEYALPFQSSALVFGVGPALTVSGTTLLDRGTPKVSTTYARAGVSGGVAFDIFLPALTLRAGVDALYAVRRFNLTFGLGATFDLGPKR